MKARTYALRVFVVICLAALLLAALTPGVSGIPLTILVNVCLYAAITASVPLPRVDHRILPQQALILPAFSPRPPPVR